LPLTDTTEKLVCRNVWKVFGARAHEALAGLGRDTSLERLLSAGLVPAVRAVDLSVRNGEIFVIMGLSGSGKSTLVRCLSRLIEPTAGEILFNGQNLLASVRCGNDRPAAAQDGHGVPALRPAAASAPCSTTWPSLWKYRGIARPVREARAREIITLVGLARAREQLPARTVRRPAAARRHRPVAWRWNRNCGFWMNPSRRSTR
jgi:glycine betaine/proline transport system ATP-binding protein